MRSVQTYQSSLSPELKDKLLHWASRFQEICWLDSNNYRQNHGKFTAILAVDALTAIKTDAHNAFEDLKEYQSTVADWIFGYLTYDLKNDVEDLVSENTDHLHFPELYFFQPKKVFLFSESSVEMHYLGMVDDEMSSDWQDIMASDISEVNQEKENPIKIKLRTSKDNYFEKVNEILSRIDRGDIYEVNFCQEFYSENVQLDPLKTFIHLNEISSPPFATFIKLDEHYALCASPERYLQRSGSTVISQPIKGTAKRLKDKEADKQMIEALLNDPKERSENIMITDLVRNDLSRFARKGTVEVEELCAIYTFEQVHQMISTVRCEIDEETSPVEIIKQTFPMGSMTGAPKISAMKIIEEMEDAKRGLYSGAVGYFDPKSNFDFNVVIRSILYNEKKRYVSYSVGGAITSKSIPENEYEECLIKAKAMREALEK
ncbi:MAG: anthranilate synthase component I family protein [Flavobacteriaceae bacterium]|nr:anthranilate synthase component I family protein [Flavobacteriaceae bacterium]